ncbi:MAG: formylglycine-generating enzyme family protein, partial [Bacteroidota bacterium]
RVCGSRQAEVIDIGEEAAAPTTTQDGVETIIVSDGATDSEDELANEIPIPKMVPIPGGTFTMGCASEERDGDCYDDEKPAHEVTVDTFYMSMHEVTVGQFASFIKDSGYQTDADQEGSSYIWTGSDVELKEGVNWKCDVSGRIRPEEKYRHPVIHVSWNDAVAYAAWLSQKTGQNYRLPTEAEWEYAARGGEEGAKEGFLYSGSNDINAVAWYASNSDRRTHEVGQKEPNQLGLYDMSGNVWEWCQDRYGEYSSGAQQNPKGAASGSNRVFRGGSWLSNPQACRAALRNASAPTSRNDSVGFRLARSSR